MKFNTPTYYVKLNKKNEVGNEKIYLFTAKSFRNKRTAVK